MRISRLSIARSMCVFRGGSFDVVKREGVVVDASLALVVDFEGQKSFP